MKSLKIILLIFYIYPLWGQIPFQVMSYNVENVFYPENDSLKADDEFTPEGIRRWNYNRYYKKLQKIVQVISAVGEWDTPALISLCEVENDTVLQHLLYKTALRKQQYQYCITHGNDLRGINSALLYQRDKFLKIESQDIPIHFSKSGERPTRNILHVSGKILNQDTLDVFVCHFPSRFGGEIETIQKRKDAALTLRRCCDSIYQIRKNTLILIMGDFNDSPNDESICKVLEAVPVIPKQKVLKNEFKLYNLFGGIQQGIIRSHKYHDEWTQLDQIIVSSAIIDGNSGLQYVEGSKRVFAPKFLLKEDEVWKGVRPFRTFHGFKYEGGFSDHLPVVADFVIYPNGFLSL